MNFISAKITGMDKIQKLFKRAPKIANQEFRIALKNSSLKTVELSKREAPVDEGRLRSSIFQKINQVSLSATIQPNVDYAIFVHDGRKAITAKSGKVLAFRPKNAKQRSIWAARGRLSKKGFVILGKRVKASKGNPFMRRAADRANPFIDKQFRAAAQRVIDKLVLPF